MRIVFFLGLVAAVAGCASKPTYTHSSIADKEKAALQYEIDDARCTQAAMGSARIPQVAYQSSPSYRSSGTITGGSAASGPSTYTYSATTRPAQSAGNSFSQGFANGMNMGAAIAARRAQEKIYHGCMLELGWRTTAPASDKPTPSAKTTLTPDEQWAQAIQTFLDVEAASPGGIDYRNDEPKLQLLDVTVRTLAKDPKNGDKSMNWFLIEANRLVKEAYRVSR